MEPRILVSADDNIAAGLVIPTLQQGWLSGVAVVDGAQCLALVRAEPLVWLFLDLQIPKMHGLKVLKEMKAIHPRPISRHYLLGKGL